MKVVKDLSLITLGAGMVLLYQKYSEPLMDSIKNRIACACDDMEDHL